MALIFDPDKYVPKYDPAFPSGHHNWPETERMKYLSKTQLRQYDSAFTFLNYMDCIHHIATGATKKNESIGRDQWDKVQKVNLAYLLNTIYNLKDKKLLQDRYCRDAAKIRKFLKENALEQANQEFLASVEKLNKATANINQGTLELDAERFYIEDEELDEE